MNKPQKLLNVGVWLAACATWSLALGWIPLLYAVVAGLLIWLGAPAWSAPAMNVVAVLLALAPLLIAPLLAPLRRLATAPAPRSRRGPLTSETASAGGWVTRSAPPAPAPVRSLRSTPGPWRSATVQGIENMEVTP